MNLFEQFYKKNNLRFINFAYNYVKRSDVAEDIVSESFITFLDQLPHLDADSNLDAYCLTIVKNKCLDYLRKQKLRYKAMSEIQDAALWTIQLDIASLEACDPSDIFSEEIMSIVKNTLDNLGTQTSGVFRMSRFQNRTNKEIAEHLEISVKGVEFHITKALSILRSKLKDYYTDLKK